MSVARRQLSIVVVVHEMASAAPRTLRSLSRAYQHDVDDLDYEVVVVDNGSARDPIDEATVASCGPEFRLLRLPPGTSPLAAANLGAASSSSDLVGVILDGACLVTPGAVAGAVNAQRLGPRVFATTYGWQLGPDLQRRSMLAGYGPEAEEQLLAEVGWPGDGYGLFRASTVDPSNPEGWFGPIVESRFFVTPRLVWEELGGYDERFGATAGGMGGLDLFRRAAEAPEVRIVALLGEGSFHQFHGGATTNSQEEWWDRFHDEYRAVVGADWTVPRPPITYLGELRGAAREWVGAARVGDHLVREMEIRRVAVPVQGATVVDAGHGFYADGWVADDAALTATVARQIGRLEIEGWAPPDERGDTTLTVRAGSGPEQSFAVSGTFRIGLDAALGPGEAAITVRAQARSRVGAAHGDSRPLAWQVGVIRFLAGFVSPAGAAPGRGEAGARAASDREGLAGP